MSAENAPETTDLEPPGFIIPGVRCALEMLLVGGLMLYVGLPATNTLYLGAVVALTAVSMTVVLFWSLNRQMEAWIVRARNPGQYRK